MAEVRERLQEIFREVFDDPALTVRDSLTAADIEGWDSLRHIDLLVAIEKEFGIRFATAEMSRTKDASSNVGTIVSLIENKLAK